MSKVVTTVCDRCGRELENVTTTSHITVSKYQDAREYDLCTACTAHLFVDFMTSNAAKRGITPNSQPVRSVGE